VRQHTHRGMSSRGTVIGGRLSFLSNAYDMCVNTQTEANIRSTLQVVRPLTLELEAKVPSSPRPRVLSVDND
jgi:hypothetical protein